jgi:hypothetical protein
MDHSSYNPDAQRDSPILNFGPALMQVDGGHIGVMERDSEASIQIQLHIVICPFLALGGKAQLHTANPNLVNDDAGMLWPDEPGSSCCKRETPWQSGQKFASAGLQSHHDQCCSVLLPWSRRFQGSSANIVAQAFEKVKGKTSGCSSLWRASSSKPYMILVMVKEGRLLGPIDAEFSSYPIMLWSI